MTIALQQAELSQLACAILRGHGADDEQARVVADILSYCDAAGLANQGCWRLPALCKRLRAGAFHCPCVLKVEQKADALVAVDGDAGLGHYVAFRAMELAISGAKRSGMTAVAVRNSNFFGAAGYYADMATRAGCIGLAFSNSYPKVAAFGGAVPVLGTNPLAMAAPRAGRGSVNIDMASAAVAGSTVRRAAERGEQLAAGVALDETGSNTTDPAAVAAGALLPLAGAKGYALGVMVEVLAGVLTGAGIGKGVGSMMRDDAEPADNGHLMIAIDISKLMPAEVFATRMKDLDEQLRVAATGADSPRLPGDAREAALRASHEHGIRLEAGTAASLAQLAKAAKVAIPWQLDDAQHSPSKSAPS